MKKFTIEVILEGQVLKAISDGTDVGTVFIGSEDHIRRVKKAIRLEWLVDIAGTRRSPAIKSGYENPLALTAALFSIMPGYTTLVDAPAEVWGFIQLHISNECPGMVTIEEY